MNKLVQKLLDSVEPKDGWTHDKYISLGNLLSATLIELTARLDVPKSCDGCCATCNKHPVVVDSPLPITEALTDEQLATVEDDIEEARRRC